MSLDALHTVECLIFATKEQPVTLCADGGGASEEGLEAMAESVSLRSKRSGWITQEFGK